jgi:thioredoxin 2
VQLVCPACSTQNRVPGKRLREDPLCGHCGAPLMGLAPAALDDERFVEGTELPVLVDYWADWFGPCKTMAPQFAAAAAQLPDSRTPAYRQMCHRPTSTWPHTRMLKPSSANMRV